MTEYLASRELNRAALITRLTAADTPIEERIEITEQLFQPRRKEEMLSEAEKDRHNRSVRFFRLMTYQELNALLNSSEVSPFVNPAAAEIFAHEPDKIRQRLKHFLQEKGIFDNLKADFAQLCSNFTIENCQTFLQTKISRNNLYEFHINGQVHSPILTGLNSMSVGAPYQTPYDSAEGQGIYAAGVPVVEFCVPSNDVTVFPNRLNVGLREMEKEVCTSKLKPEWITTVYNGMADFDRRFVRDPQTVLYPEYVAAKNAGVLIMDYLSESRIMDMLQHWKEEESLADLIPRSKLSDLDDNNPDLKKPLITIS
jgi:hypothetical protein